MLTILALFKRYGMNLLRQFKSATPVLLLLGVVFLLIGIWWLGPQWTWHERKPVAALPVRVLLTLILLLVPTLVWALVLYSHNMRFKEQARRAMNLEADPGLRFVQAQERALDQSLAVLKANLQGRQALYKLPWYLLLGQEGSGKTSFVNRSNQSFSLTSVTRAGSERIFDDPDLAYPIDWWMGDEAVLIDPPGELITQIDDPAKGQDSGESHDVGPSDASSSAPEPNGSVRRNLPPGTHARLWQNLVGWLGRNRSRRPLNGVVLMVDLVNLFNQQPSDRKALAILLRARLAELSQQLGTRPPLYVVLSKFDQIEGFGPFFERLPRAVREDIFGFTFTLDSVQNFDAWLNELSSDYDTFIERLNEQVFDALAERGTVEQRDGLFSFMRQVAGLRPILLGFLADVLGSDRYATPALPRGVYFSSVFQQGQLTNAFVSAAAHAYDLEAPLQSAQPVGRTMVYFAQQLFQKVIYPEAGLAGDNLKVLADKKRTLMVGFGVAALGSLLVIGGWQHYYRVNRDMALGVLAKGRDFHLQDVDTRMDPTGRNLLGPLDQIREAVSIYGDYRDAWSVVSGMGLYQGRKIGPKVDEGYLQLLSRRFLPELAGGMMDTVNAASTGSNEQLAALRVYRMIEDRQNRRAPIVEGWMARQWQAAFPGDGMVQTALMRHLDYAMKYADADLPQYRQRVAEVQQQLRQIPLPQRVYMTMQQQADEILHAPLDLRHEVGPAFDIVYKPVAVGGEPNADGIGASGVRIDALLTANGFRDYFQPHSQDVTDLAMIDQWTLGERRQLDYSDADRQALAERIRAIYGADYVGTWRRELNLLQVMDFNNLAQAEAVLGTVTGPAAPLRRLVETVRDNTASASLVSVEDGKGKASSGNDADRKQAADIGRAFAPLNDLLAPRGDKPSYLDETTAAISSVHDTVKSVQDSPDTGKAALGVVLDRFALKGPDAIGNLQRVAAGLPEPLNQQVKKLADESSQILLIEALRELQQRWDTDVYSFYSEHLAGRYPFDPASRTDASLEDFEAFFGPQGRLQQFQDKYLNVFLKDNLDALYSERRGGYLVRTDVMTQLEAANRIRDAFFNNRGALGVQFAVQPLGLTPNRRSSVLGVDGQLIPYNHGPSNSVGLIWPNTLGDSTDSRITLVNSSGNSSSLVFRGAWSMFRLLSRAQLTGATANSIDLSFTADDGGAMRYRVTAEKANNPFTQRIFNGFALPRTLLQDQAVPVRQDASRSVTSVQQASATPH